MPMNLWSGVGGQVYFYYIESGIDFFLRAQEAQPIEQADAQKAAFGGIYHAHGGAAAVAGGTFHLHSYQRITVAAHEVQLTPLTPAPVAAQNCNTLRPQVRGGHQLPVLTHAGGGGWGIRAPRAAPFVQQAQTCGDGES